MIARSKELMSAVDHYLPLIGASPKSDQDEGFYLTLIIVLSPKTSQANQSPQCSRIVHTAWVVVSCTGTWLCTFPAVFFKDDLRTALSRNPQNQTGQVGQNKRRPGKISYSVIILGPSWIIYCLPVPVSNIHLLPLWWAAEVCVISNWPTFF